MAISKKPEIAETPSLPATLTAAVDHLSNEDVKERVDVLGNCPDLYTTQVTLAEILQTTQTNILTGRARLYQDPSEFLKSSAVDEFDEKIVNIDPCLEANHTSYCRVWSDVVDFAGNTFSHINGRGKFNLDADEFGLDMSEVDDHSQAVS